MMIEKIRIPQSGVAILRDAMRVYRSGGILSFETDRNALDDLSLRVASVRKGELVCTNSQPVRDAAICLLRDVEVQSNPETAARFRDMADLFKRFGDSAIDMAHAEKVLDDVAKAVESWKSRWARRHHHLHQLMKNHYLPMAQAIEDKVDMMTLRAAGVFAVRLAEDLDIIDAWARRRGVRRSQSYDLLRGAMHLVFGMNRINRSLSAIDSDLFDGNEKLTFTAVKPAEDTPAALVSINYRYHGMFLRRVHGDSVLRALGRAEEYMERAGGRGDMQAARSLIEYLQGIGVYEDDPVAEYGRLTILRAGLDILEEKAGVSLPNEMENLSRMEEGLKQRLFDNAGASPGHSFAATSPFNLHDRGPTSAA